MRRRDPATFSPIVFYGSYPVVALIQGQCNVWEQRADFAAGGYHECLNESVVAPGMSQNGKV
jgi:hypothetical protein